ncbi:hypothetical protein CC1G_04109 [Coprinopsis cinerea okayama7|uniref:Uncharacterized protein n=1 Tax=Coprinopsis cinerea (strain Okayama-7 / 130 / ATCC MYA-4618 / FGSC 9003) TaxID=240176 RepID=A8NW07_COPC7|nr:hypothetical protein CC1G_04109 [Coprinopsis cinerea okayama7\|eukprot:XP_001836796.2 hypothetical protein CC1G_04109 [Coprinopsis cinerea okayama7\
MFDSIRNCYAAELDHEHRYHDYRLRPRPPPPPAILRHRLRLRQPATTIPGGRQCSTRFEIAMPPTTNTGTTTTGFDRDHHRRRQSFDIGFDFDNQLPPSTIHHSPLGSDHHHPPVGQGHYSIRFESALPAERWATNTTWRFNRDHHRLRHTDDDDHGHCSTRFESAMPPKNLRPLPPPPPAPRRAQDWTTSTPTTTTYDDDQIDVGTVRLDSKVPYPPNAGRRTPHGASTATTTVSGTPTTTTTGTVRLDSKVPCRRRTFDRYHHRLQHPDAPKTGRLRPQPPPPTTTKLTLALFVSIRKCPTRPLSP